MADLVSIEQVIETLNLGDDTSQINELLLYMDALSDHITRRVGVFATEYTEVLTSDCDGRLRPQHYPVTAVASATSVNYEPTAYDSDFEISADGYFVTHDSIGYADTWTVVYTAGYASAPADLQLAVLEDLRGIFQPGQIGPPAAFGAFGIESTDTGPTSRPVRMWPRVDAWINDNRVPAFG